MDSLREKLRRNAAPFLDTGERIDAVVVAQRNPPAAKSFTGADYVVLIATDKRILLCKGGAFRMSPVRKVLTQFPRDTKLGPVDEHLWHEYVLPLPVPVPVWIQRRFFKDVAEADVAQRQAETSW